MSEHNQIEAITGGILMAAMIGAENGRMRAQARQEQRQEIIAHNRCVAQARAAHRRRDAIAAQQVALGQARIGRWIDRAAH